MSVDLASLADEATGYAAANRAASTIKAYSSDWRHFSRWATARGLGTLPATPATIALYLSDLARTHKAATIARRVAAIAVAHRRQGLASPTADPGVREVLRGIRRQLGTAQAEAAALSTADIVRMVATLPAGVSGTRDRALLLVGFAGAMRASELVGLDTQDLEERPEGMVAVIRSSKTDQEAAGRRVALPFGKDGQTCPVGAVRAWLDLVGLTEGPLFRRVDRHSRLGSGRLTAQSVGAIVRRSACAAGMDTTRLSGHSLRAGFTTTAAANGASERAIAAQTGHRSMEVLRRYIRHGTVFTDNGVSALGL